LLNGERFLYIRALDRPGRAVGPPDRADLRRVRGDVVVSGDLGSADDDPRGAGRSHGPVPRPRGGGRAAPLIFVRPAAGSLITGGGAARAGGGWTLQLRGKPTEAGAAVAGLHIWRSGSKMCRRARAAIETPRRAHGDVLP
jgi:hypothetical protein